MDLALDRWKSGGTLVLRHCLAVSGLLLLLEMPLDAKAENGLSPSVQAEAGMVLSEIGHGTYRKFGFSIYRITLWSAGDHWDNERPYALHLRYTRDLAKATLVDGICDDLSDEGLADAERLTRWRNLLNQILPDVKDGDELIVMAQSKQKSFLFHNGEKTATITDPEFIQAFFSLWLGERADQDLRNNLLQARTTVARE